MKQKHDRSGVFRGFLRGTWATFILAVVMSVTAAFAEMLQPQIIRAAVDNALQGSPSRLPAWINRRIDAIGGFEYLGRHIWILALAVLIVAVLQLASQYANRVMTARSSETLAKNMRDDLFAHIERLPYAWFSANRTGDVIQRCTSDVNTIQNFFSEQMIPLVRILLLVVLSLTFMWRMHRGLTLVAMIPMPVIILFSYFFHKRMHAIFTECDENEGKLSAMAQENLAGVRVIRAFGQERDQIEKFTAHNKFYTGLWVRLSRLLGRFWTVAEMMSALQVMLVVVAGAVCCVKYGLSDGEYLAFISYNALLVGPFRMLGRLISGFSKASVAAERIRYIMDEPAEADPPDAVDAPMDGDIVFDHVRFRYENAPELLRDVSFTVKAGTTLGILGGTGSGKSTLVLLLDRLYDLPEGCGAISIGGVDVRRIRASHLRENIGVILQEPFLFSRTIAENIDVGTDSRDPERIRRAAAAAALDESVMSFPKGYDTMVGERGVTLSGGQKQRAAIARTFMREHPILIFDDSLSAVDTRTDAAIRAAIAERFGKATVILISHRVTTLANADNIIVLDHGRVAEQGSHDALKAAGGLYQRIYEAQNGLGEGGAS